MKREQNIETLRGIAIILMVLGHVVGNDSTKGLKVSEDSWYYYLFFIFKYARMPLFTVVSGYVYALKPVTGDYSKWQFVLRKIQRLLIPYLIAATLFFFMQIVVPGTNSSMTISDLPSVFYRSYMHFWFAQGIFFVFIIIAILEAFNLLGKFKYWFLTFAIVSVFYLIFNIHSNILSLNKWPFLLLFFLWGLGIKRFQFFSSINLLSNKGLYLFIFGITFVLQQLVFFSGNIDLIGEFEGKLLTYLVGLSAAYLLVTLRMSNSFLENIGNYSYEIYLYHVFGTAGIRIVLYKVGITNLSIHLIIGLLAGILFPIVFKIFIKKIPQLNAVLFGDRISTKKA